MTISSQDAQLIGMAHAGFASLVQRVIELVEKTQLEEMRKDFHIRLRMTLTQPENTELIEDLWDFFYDWCFFEQKLPDHLGNLGSTTEEIWKKIRDSNLHGLYSVTKITEEYLRLKDLYTNEQYIVNKQNNNDFIGITRGDLIEARLIELHAGEKKIYQVARKPSFHPPEVQNYIKKKVKYFRKLDDFVTYQAWLWLLVGMSLKHRMYQHMPIEKIYDDNSRI